MESTMAKGQQKSNREAKKPKKEKAPKAKAGSAYSQPAPVKDTKKR
jgi:hypothetical protein